MVSKRSGSFPGVLKVRQVSMANTLSRARVVVVVMTRPAKNLSFIVTSLQAVANFFGPSRNAIEANWVPKGMPGEKGPGKGKPGRFDLAEIARWREAFLLSLVKAPQDEEQKALQDRLEVAQIRKAEAQATIEEIKLGELQGRFVDKNEILAEIHIGNFAVKHRLEQIPNEMASSFPPEIRGEMTQDMKHKIRLALREIASWEDGIPQEVIEKVKEALGK